MCTFDARGVMEGYKNLAASGIVHVAARNDKPRRGREPRRNYLEPLASRAGFAPSAVDATGTYEAIRVRWCSDCKAPFEVTLVWKEAYVGMILGTICIQQSEIKPRSCVGYMRMSAFKLGLRGASTLGCDGRDCSLAGLRSGTPSSCSQGGCVGGGSVGEGRGRRGVA